LFPKNNPGTLKELSPNPLRVLVILMCLKSVKQLQEYDKYCAEELLNSGEVEKLIKKYKLTPESFYRVAAPYQIPPITITSKK